MDRKGSNCSLSLLFGELEDSGAGFTGVVGVVLLLATVLETILF